jgi:hypothetical protein
MIVGGEDSVSGFWSDVGKGLKQVGVDTATGAARAAAGSAGKALTKGSEKIPQTVPAAKTGGIPTGVLIAGSVVLGIGILALVTHRSGPAPRPSATNPRRRRRRRRSR